jgi:lipid-A-disaccharide synthase
MLHVGIVAGESSGDQIGAALIGALRRSVPGLRITGMAGPKMKAAGCEAIASVDELSVMGLVEVVRQYPRLRRLRERLCQYYLTARPDVFVGIDVPDFVMGIEARLHAKRVKTIHYVAPQIWAWRQSRARKIAGRLDLLLALFPFEESFFRQYGIDARFVGHPVADQIPLERDMAGARGRLGLDRDRSYVALMPGSRKQELRRHVDLFLEAAGRIAEEIGDVAFVAGAIDADAREFMLQRSRLVRPAIELDVRQGDAHDVLGACDAALVASGTVTLEGMFCKTPMVVSYRLAPLTFCIMKRLVKIPYVAMPNILAATALVPEYVQREVRPELLARAITGWLRDGDRVAHYQTKCMEIHKMLRRNAAARAAREVLRLAGVSRSEEDVDSRG